MSAGGREVARLPSSFAACQARFRDTCERASHRWSYEPIAARGPDDAVLTIDHVTIGAQQPARALVLLSGVHGVEGHVNSALQCDFVGRLDPGSLPGDVGVVVVHVVNPWGMAHDRRQNESNVDLNRNWARSRREVVHNDAYDEVHTLVCPDTEELPDVDALLAQTKSLVAERGERWVERAITNGQYRHRDGVHFGGDHTEESTLILERLLPPRLAAADRVFVMDLHTGHGPYGELVVLSDQPHESPQDRLLRSLFPNVETTADDDQQGSQVKAGPIARGIVADLMTERPSLEATVATVEVGTLGDLDQLAVTCREQWVHRHGDRSNPAHRRVRNEYRACFSPDDPAWERAALEAGRQHIDQALAAVVA